MSSNYPPGVTGREYQIAGPSGGERDEERTCGAKDVHIMNIQGPGVEYLRLAKNELAKLTTHQWPNDMVPPGAEEKRQIASTAYNLLEMAGRTISDGVDMDCPFVGDVTIELDQGVMYWECPLCGTEHEEELEMPEPPDRDEDY